MLDVDGAKDEADEEPRRAAGPAQERRQAISLRAPYRGRQGDDAGGVAADPQQRPERHDDELLHKLPPKAG
jgi:hypothetical protein